MAAAGIARAPANMLVSPSQRRLPRPADTGLAGAPKTLVRTEIVRINSENPEPGLVTYVAGQIKSGKVLGMPTDTFYGLAADPFNLRAVHTVNEISNRSRHKPLSLLIESVDKAEELARPLP